MFALRTKVSLLLVLGALTLGGASLVFPAGGAPSMPAARAAPVPTESFEVKNKKMEELWPLLLPFNEAISSRALLELSGRPKREVVAFLAGKLRPIALTKEQAEKLIAGLGDDDDAVAKAAYRELAIFDPRLALEPDVAFKMATGKQAKRRLAALLCGYPVEEADEYAWCELECTRFFAGPGAANRKMNFGLSVKNDPDKPAGFQTALDRSGNSGGIIRIVPHLVSELHLREWNRSTRAIMLLEHLSGPEALKVLEEMAAGHKDAAPTKAAAEALERLKKK